MNKSVNAHLRYQEKCCGTCRYYRLHKTSAVTSDCLLLGRMLGINTSASDFFYWDMSRFCDFWAKRPKKWTVYSVGVDKNPHWVDPYLPRETLIQLRKRLRLE